MTPNTARFPVLWAFALLLAVAAALVPALAAVPVTIGDEDPMGCVKCHSDLGASGHFPPEVAGCLTCHVSTGPPPAGRHVAFTPATGDTCNGCHPMPEPTFEHAPVAAKDCMACHDPHSTAVVAPHKQGQKLSHLYGKEPEVCDDCHDRVDDTRFVHSAVGLGRCSSCHAVHGAEQPALLLGETPSDGCRSCHPAEFKKDDFDHLPAAMGQCDACHDAHGSENEFNLVLPNKETCYQCHAPKETKVQVHSAVVLGRCTECHDPHGSDNDRKLRGSPVSEVCFRCHNDDINGRKVVHAPVGEGNCLICHDPHSTPVAKNLRAPVNQTCAMCHPDKLRTEVKTPHPAVLVYGCTACHDPHASDNEFRLRKPIVQLCTSCHAGYDDGFHVVQRPTGGGHPIGGKPDPMRPGRELVCTSCHDPHGTENPRMWYRAYERFALCVECHRATLAPGTEVGKSGFELDAEAARKRDLEAKTKP